MIVTKISDETEPVWDEVGIHGCDFRPHFDGDLHNLFTTIYPLGSKADTERLFVDIARTIADWILANCERFGSGDRFQIIAGWPLDVRPTGRQVIKTGGDFATIKRLLDDPALIQIRKGWTKGVFTNVTENGG
ncbi:MAG: hypothetical protein MI861_27550 [Pirellulales bacterium]|nr:hypothetical protein [Pirellulales bacterium]